MIIFLIKREWHPAQFLKKIYLTAFLLAIIFNASLSLVSPAYAASGPGDAIRPQSKLGSYELHIPVGELADLSAADFASGRALPKYITVLYQWLVGFTLFLGVIALMVAGTLWILAGGNKGRADQAKGIIKNIIVGVFLALGSYLFLWTISPNLLQFRPIQVKTVADYDLQIILPEEATKTDNCKDCRDERGSKFKTHYCFQDKECRKRAKKGSGGCKNTNDCEIGLYCDPATKTCKDASGPDTQSFCCNIIKQEIKDKNGSPLGPSSCVQDSKSMTRQACGNVGNIIHIGKKPIETEKDDFALVNGQTRYNTLLMDQKYFCVLGCPTYKDSNCVWEQPIHQTMGCSK